MFRMIITPNLNKILIYAQDEAERLQSREIQPEHMLLAIFRLIECSAYDLLLRAQFKPEEAKEPLEDAVRGSEELENPVEQSPQVERILRIADEIAVLRDGTLAQIGSRDDVLPELIGTSSAVSACRMIDGGGQE